MFIQDSPVPFAHDLKSFFIKHQQLLDKFYPGLTLQRLEVEAKQLDFQDYNEFTHWQDSLTRGIPLEYLSGQAYFYKSEFFVDTNVLIPRSETELLVEIATNLLQKNSTWKMVLDLGTGSGAIALSIAQEIDRPLEFILSDVSAKVLSVAKINRWKLAYRMTPKHHFTFCLSDRFTELKQNFSLIVTNPPYIKMTQDRDGVHPQVVQYGPELALFLEDDIYEQWFSELFQDAYRHLLPGGYFLMEGHEDHLTELRNLCEKHGFINVKIIKDLCGCERFIQGQKGMQLDG